MRMKVLEDIDFKVLTVGRRSNEEYGHYIEGIDINNNLYEYWEDNVDFTVTSDKFHTRTYTELRKEAIKCRDYPILRNITVEKRIFELLQSKQKDNVTLGVHLLFKKDGKEK